MPGPPSAIVGQPPLTADDTLIVHGWQVLMGMGQKDPSLGLTVAARPPPPGQPHTSNTKDIAVGCAISMVLMTLFTGTRLLIRGTNKTLVWGMDDWTILFGTVGLPSSPYDPISSLSPGSLRHPYQSQISAEIVQFSDLCIESTGHLLL